MTATPPGARIIGPYEDQEESGLITAGFVALWNVEESRADANADLDVSNVPGMEADEAILGGFLGKEEFTFSGKATGNRLGGDATPGGGGRNNLAGHPITSLKEYAIRLESLATDKQGVGYGLEDLQRDTTISPEDEDGLMIESVSWTRSEAEPFDLQYTVDCARATGTGMEPEEGGGRDSYISRQKDEWILDEYDRLGRVPRFIPYDDELWTSGYTDIDGITYEEDYSGVQSRGEIIYTGGSPGVGEVFDLGSVKEKRFERDVPIDVTELALADPGDNIGIPTGGPTESIFIEGVLSPSHLTWRSSIDSEEDAIDRLNLFSRYVPNNWVGTNTEVSYIDTFTDRIMAGQIEDFSTTWSSGMPVQLEYTLEIQIGDTL